MREWTAQIAEAFIGLAPTEAAQLAQQAAVPLEDAKIDPATGCRVGEMYGGATWTVFLDYEDGVVVRVTTFQ